MTEVYSTNDIAEMLKKTVKDKYVRIGDTKVKLSGKILTISSKNIACVYNLNVFNDITMQIGKAIFKIDTGHLYMSIKSKEENNG